MEGEAEVVARDLHTNVTFIEVNGKIFLEKPEEEEAASASPLIHRYFFRELLDYMPDCFDLLLLDSAVNISSLNEQFALARKYLNQV